MNDVIKNLKSNQLGFKQQNITKDDIFEIVNTLIREDYISSLQHAADMGIELCKAELALKNNYNYIQDKDLDLK